ncbi:DDE-type integrase/transposase/recombinase [Streptomyces sp. NPDC059832]|uniref:DDE-type integrase/transposase/recombinase n=1 Tax=Streptomyces sp. NPDC059832 TaxID=3346966 RepID=UPI003652E6C1
MLGWPMAPHMRAELVIDALQAAVATCGRDVTGVTFHADHGSHYTSAAFAQVRDLHGIRRSMNRVGSSHDCEDGITVAGGGLTGVTTDPSGVLAVDLSVTPAAGLMRAAGRTGSDRVGARCPQALVTPWPPARPAVSC